MINKLLYLLKGRPYDPAKDGDYIPRANCSEFAHVYSYTLGIRSKKCKCGKK
jgi:hypothetical protein